MKRKSIEKEEQEESKWSKSVNGDWKSVEIASKSTTDSDDINKNSMTTTSTDVSL